MTLATGLLATAALAASLPAQTALPAAFEAASVKPSKLADRPIGMQFLPGGRLVVAKREERGSREPVERGAGRK